MKFKKIICGLFIATLMFACETNEIDLVDDTVTLSESESMRGIANAPEQSGPYLFRFEEIFAILLIDLEKGISVTMGVDEIAFCNGEVFWDFAMTQFIDIPNDELRAIALQQDETYTEVFDGAYAGGDLCDFFTNTPILAEGMSKFIYNDNDVFYSDATNNTNSWGFRCHGRLMNQDGEMKNLSASYHEVWDKQDRLKSKTSIRLR